jgi:hypothetical protein
LKVTVEIEVSDHQRALIGHNYFRTMKAAPEEGVKVWIQEKIAEDLRELTASE